MVRHVPQPRILIADREPEGAAFDLPADGSLLVGHDSSCNVVLREPVVSRFHLRFFRDDRGSLVEDLGSERGTYVEGQRVLRVRHLVDGDVLVLGHPKSGVVIRFEDPAERLLREMGLLDVDREREPDETPLEESAEGREPEGKRDVSLPEEGAAVEAGESLPAARRLVESPREGPVEEGPVENEGSTAELGSGAAIPPSLDPEDPDLDPDPVGRLSPRRLTTVAAPVLGGIALVVLAWILVGSSPATLAAARLSHTDVSAGSVVYVYSESIEPDDVLSASIAGEPVSSVRVLPGRLECRIPAHNELPAGHHSLPLTVERDGRVVFRAAVRYEMRPRVLRVDRQRARVGEEILIEGMGLVDGAGAGLVLVGGSEAPVLEPDPQRLRVEIPPVWKGRDVEVPVEVRAAEWNAVLDGPLTVLAPLREPLELVFEASYRLDLGAWEMRSPLGPLFFVDLPGRPDEPPPGKAQEMSEALETLFRRAREDESLRVAAVVAPQGGYHLVVRGAFGVEPEPLLLLERVDLELTSREAGISGQVERMAVWLERILNDFLETLARGRPVGPRQAAPEYVEVLDRLVEASRRAGGDGRPARTDLDSLPVTDQSALEMAALSPPPGVASIEGEWNGEVTNLFYAGDQIRVSLRLELEQDRSALSGRAEIAFRDEGMVFGPPPAEIEGRLVEGVEQRIELEIPFRSPVGTLTLEGEVRAGRLGGTFVAPRRPEQGEWYVIPADRSLSGAPDARGNARLPSMGG